MTDVVKNYKDIEKSVEKDKGERKDITNRRGNVVEPRKYHMTDAQIDKGRERWLEGIKGVPGSIRNKCNSNFFNPYRANGSYYGGVQALFLLGSNEWHRQSEIRDKMLEDMSTRSSSTNRLNSWEKFSTRGGREGAASTKDLMGRIVQNFRTLQRLGGVHPYGWKLKQMLASVDVQRGVDGVWYFKLNTTWKDIESVKPYYDTSSFKEPKAQKVEEKVVVSAEEATV